MPYERSILYDFLEGGGKPMKCPKCESEMRNPILNVSLMEKLWKCPSCNHRLTEKVETDEPNKEK